MRAKDGVGRSTAGNGRAPASRTPASRPAVRPDTPLTPQALRSLQGTVGNAAVVQLLHQGGHRQEQEQEQGAGSGLQPTGRAEVQRAAVHDVLRSGGRPLDDTTRATMEARLGADFSDVRVHSGSAARASATALGARAYTSGNHVVIGDGGADAHTLAHELTHVIQQRQGPVAGTDNGDGLKVSSPDDRFEREAEANARRALSGPVPATDAGTVQRSGAYSPPGRHEEHVQRAVAYRQDSDTGSAEDQAAFQRIVTGLDEAVQWAYDYVRTTPGLGALAEFDGHTKHWVRTWEAYLGSDVGSPSKEFGYAVESVATYRLKGRTTFANHHIGLQEVHGGTRPDVVLTGPGGRLVAALDITASSSGLHIFKKDNWEGRFPSFAEITYNSLTPETLMLMRARKDATGSVSAQELAAFEAAATEQRARFEARRSEIRADFDTYATPLAPKGEASGLQPQLSINVVLSWLRSGRFDLSNDVEGLDKTASCVLAALGVGGKSWGFITGYTANVARGESFLMVTDTRPTADAWGRTFEVKDLDFELR
ncbi:eCIS core domain-containing protein [Streptomyces halstedii]|uniref:eCIS core domain-containing protein n=1 Tax=Streptomyces halstedii TaxID=1944 RepID=UPI00346131E6